MAVGRRNFGRDEIAIWRVTDISHQRHTRANRSKPTHHRTTTVVHANTDGQGPLTEEGSSAAEGVIASVDRVDVLVVERVEAAAVEARAVPRAHRRVERLLHIALDRGADRVELQDGAKRILDEQADLL